MNEIKQIQKISLKSLFQIKNLLCLFSISFIFIIDRVSKIKAIDQLVDQNNLYINDFLNFSLVWNTGIGFGLLSANTNIVYNLITMLIGVIIIFYFIW